MKKLIVAAIMVMASSQVFEANAQALEIEKNKVVERSEVPAKILSAFANEFPEASAMMSDEVWHLHYVEGKGYAEPRTYRVEIDNSQLTFSGHYRADGVFLKANETMKDASLPSVVKSSISNEYSNWNIVDRAEVKTIAKSRRDKDEYEVKIDNGQQQRMLVVSADGKIKKDKSAK